MQEEETMENTMRVEETMENTMRVEADDDMLTVVAAEDDLPMLADDEGDGQAGKEQVVVVAPSRGASKVRIAQTPLSSRSYSSAPYVVDAPKLPQIWPPPGVQIPGPLKFRCGGGTHMRNQSNVQLLALTRSELRDQKVFKQRKEKEQQEKAAFEAAAALLEVPGCVGDAPTIRLVPPEEACTPESPPPEDDEEEQPVVPLAEESPREPTPRRPPQEPAPGEAPSVVVEVSETAAPFIQAATSPPEATPKAEEVGEDDETYAAFFTAEAEGRTNDEDVAVGQTLPSDGADALDTEDATVEKDVNEERSSGAFQPVVGILASRESSQAQQVASDDNVSQTDILVSASQPTEPTDGKLVVYEPPKELSFQDKLRKAAVEYTESTWEGVSREARKFLSTEGAVYAKSGFLSGGLLVPQDGLPPGWTLGYSQTRRQKYYIHEGSGRTQWTPPSEEQIAEAFAAVGENALDIRLATRGSPEHCLETSLVSEHRDEQVDEHPQNMQETEDPGDLRSLNASTSQLRGTAATSALAQEEQVGGLDRSYRSPKAYNVASTLESTRSLAYSVRTQSGPKSHGTMNYTGPSLEKSPDPKAATTVGATGAAEGEGQYRPADVDRTGRFTGDARRRSWQL
eukprot:TRINITY_DN14436_c0_g2_i1.p1 TRINITY_DN14436_c0_g2~~TRINITY_DN14436_c0_g2_i1.p1  ORF type:complete len:710 (+),score=176.08 TRINITY_DN14436_c0_g2_i1:250-2130(+)